MAPKKGWIWLPAAWRDTLSRQDGFRMNEQRMQIRVLQEYLRPRYFFERIKYLTSFVVIRVTHLYAENVRSKKLLGVDIRICGAFPGDYALGLIFHHTLDSTGTVVTTLTSPSTAQIDAFIVEMARRGAVRAAEAKRSATVPAQLRQDRIDTTKERIQLRAKASAHSRTVWEGLKSGRTQLDAAHELASALEKIYVLDQKLDMMNAKINAIKAGDVLVEDGEEKADDPTGLDLVDG
jgi:hypothetical protein